MVAIVFYLSQLTLALNPEHQTGFDPNILPLVQCDENGNLLEEFDYPASPQPILIKECRAYLLKPNEPMTPAEVLFFHGDSHTRGTFSYDSSRGLVTVGFHKLPIFTEGMFGSIHIITTDDQRYCTKKYALDPATRCDTGGVVVTNGADGIFSSPEESISSPVVQFKATAQGGCSLNPQATTHQGSLWLLILLSILILTHWRAYASPKK